MGQPPTVVGQVTNRRFQTESDRDANDNRRRGERRQRSHSIHREYSDGSVTRVHRHDNVRSGDQFEHVIGGWNADGVYRGRDH